MAGSGFIAKRVTVFDVAKAAGVSGTTVSNVINGKLSGMSEQTRLRVLREIERLDYRPNEAARNLRLAQSSTVGLVVVHESPRFLASPFIAMIVTGLTNILAEHGLNLIVQGLHPDKFTSSALLRRVGLNGLVATMAGTDAVRRRFQKSLSAIGLPLVLIQDRPLCPLDDCLIINQDDFTGGKVLAELLAKDGARRLLIVKPLVDWPAMKEREKGVRRALVGHGAEIDVLAVPDESFAGTQAALARYLDQAAMPDAILGANDQMAIAAMKLVQARGLSVPQDVLITGYNDFEYRTYAEPAVTTIKSRPYEMGMRAGEEMAFRIANGKFRTPGHVLFPAPLVPGGSTRSGMPATQTGPARRKAAGRLSRAHD
jgi:DNA-binding LacI/PurR family transcriptional regulator